MKRNIAAFFPELAGRINEITRDELLEICEAVNQEINFDLKAPMAPVNNQPISQSLNQSITQPISQPINQPSSQTLSQLNQPSNQPTNLPNKQLVQNI